MKKIAIIGSSGQLGTDLSEALVKKNTYELHLLDHTDIECTDRQSVDRALLNIEPDIVINCAAFVRVDDCENYPETAFGVNALGAGYVARACSEIDAVSLYLSTDYVFDGTKDTPYSEEDPQNPLNVYGISKLTGEHLVRNYCEKHFIVRSSGLYGLKGGGKLGSGAKGGNGDNGDKVPNFVETMLKLSEKGGPIRVVDDQMLTPTFTKDLARALADLVDTGEYGTYHSTNSGECSWYEFGKAVFEISDREPDYVSVSSSSYGARAARPAYSVLDNSRINELGIAPLREWRDALREYLELRSGA